MCIEIEDKRSSRVPIKSVPVGSAFLYDRDGLYIVISKVAGSGSVCCFHVSSATIVDFSRDTYINPVKVTLTIE